jgi:hypothetical protein
LTKIAIGASPLEDGGFRGNKTEYLLVDDSP